MKVLKIELLPEDQERLSGFLKTLSDVKTEEQAILWLLKNAHNSSQLYASELEDIKKELSQLSDKVDRLLKYRQFRTWPIQLRYEPVIPDIEVDPFPAPRHMPEGRRGVLIRGMSRIRK